MNVVYQFKSVTEEQGETSLFSFHCFNSEYNIHIFFIFFLSLSLQHIILQESCQLDFHFFIITTLLALG